MNPEGLEILRRGGVPVHRSIELAVECLAAAADYAQARTRVSRGSAPLSIARSAVTESLIENCRSAGRLAMLEHEARELLTACRIPLAPHTGAGTKADIALDPQFGHVIMLDCGGIFAEILKDTVILALPLGAEDMADDRRAQVARDVRRCPRNATDRQGRPG